MTKSSRTRRAKARARKLSTRNNASNNDSLSANAAALDGEVDKPKLTLNDTDKRYLIGFAILSLVITAVYFWIGGRNLFVFPAIFCASVGARKYWKGPIRRFADKASSDN